MNKRGFITDNDEEVFISLRRLLFHRSSTVVCDWQQLLISAGIDSIPFNRLHELVNDIVTLLCMESPDSVQAQIVGEQICDLYRKQPSLFGETQRIISQSLVAELPFEQVILAQQRIITFFSACATGFITRLHEIVVTEQHTVSDQLHIAEYCLNTIVTNLPLFAFVLDVNHVFRYIDGKALKYLKLTPYKVVGQFVADVIPDPDVLYHVHCALRGERFVAAIELQDIVLEMRYGPLEDKQGVICGVIGIAYDVTRSTRLEEVIHKLSNESSKSKINLCNDDQDNNSVSFYVFHDRSDNEHVLDDRLQGRETGQLSRREFEILERVGMGMTNKEIAKDLMLSPTTVKWYLEQVYRKLQVSNRTAAVYQAQALGILPKQP